MKRDVRRRGGDPSLVNGVGVFKQYLPAKARTNPLTGPRTGNYRPIWAYRHVKPLGFVDIAFIGMRLPTCRSIIQFLVGKRIFLVCNTLLVIYFYISYTRYLVMKIISTFHHYKVKY